MVAFAAQGNAHDQYFFGRRDEMIAGAVAPARMDLQNEELVKAHLYSTWLASAWIVPGQRHGRRARPERPCVAHCC